MTDTATEAGAPPRLTAEWLGSADLPSTLRRRLTALGVERDAILRAGGLAASRIHAIGRTYTPAGYGRFHIITPVWAGPAPSIFEDVEHPILLDLLAWHPENPDTWFYRIGATGLFLGEHYYLAAIRSAKPFRAFATPLAWLQGDCAGAVFLDDAERRWRGEVELDRVDALEIWQWRFAQ